MHNKVVWPTRTEHDGRPEHWTAAVKQQWITRVAPRFKDMEFCSTAHYHEPRPWVDEYNTGSDQYGFTYVVQPGNHVCFVTWTRGT